jgi:holo-ACP synthase CitX
MSCDALRLKLLAARDARQQALARALPAGWPATLALALNIAGADKTPPGAGALFSVVMRRLAEVFPQGVVLQRSDDALGPCALLGLRLPADEAKRLCLTIEESEPAARLVDLDVYCADGTQLGRAQLGLPARRCLVCGEAAVDCMREKRHPLEAIVARTDELLVAYRA